MPGMFHTQSRRLASALTAALLPVGALALVLTTAVAPTPALAGGPGQGTRYQGTQYAGAGTMSRYLFDDIRVENASWRLFYLAVENNKWYDPAAGYGELDQIIFRNIHAYTNYQKPNVITGIDSTHKARNINFQNVFTDGICISNAVNGNFQITPGSTNAIRIMKSSDGSCAT